jgi:hypothetical protein
MIKMPTERIHTNAETHNKRHCSKENAFGTLPLSIKMSKTTPEIIRKIARLNKNENFLVYDLVFSSG